MGQGQAPVGHGQDPDGRAGHAADGDGVDGDADQVDDVDQGEGGLQRAAGAVEVEGDQLVALAVQGHQLGGGGGGQVGVQLAADQDRALVEQAGGTQSPKAIGGSRLTCSLQSIWRPRAAA